MEYIDDNITDSRCKVKQKVQHAYISGIANKYAICRKKMPIHNNNKWKNILSIYTTVFDD